jgi:hypothetical protein
MGRHFVAAVLLGSLAGMSAAACSADDESAIAEDDLTKDTFDRPTQHGDVRFGGSPNEAAFREDQRFHAWTFTLSGDARVDLATTVGPNVDTVAFLYRRDAGSNGGWGPSIAANDDTAGTIASRIDKALGAGEYLLKVKASKTAIVGPFAVVATCTGEGCPAAGPTCDPGSFAKMPAARAFAASCTDKLDAVLAAPITAASGTTTTLPRRCSLAPVERLAVELYRAFWDDLIGWEELTSAAEGEPELSVTRESHGTAGTVVDVDVQADESAMTFVFGPEAELLFYYQHNQSPTFEWFCASPGEAASAAPPESCVSQALASVASNGTRRFTCR